MSPKKWFYNTEVTYTHETCCRTSDETIGNGRLGEKDGTYGMAVRMRYNSGASYRLHELGLRDKMRCLCETFGVLVILSEGCACQSTT
jgi:hypothetical protein